MKLNNKIFIVTGGAGGICQEVVLKLLENGASVVAISRSEQKLKLLKDKINHNKLFTFVADVSDQAEIEKVFSQIISEHKIIDGLINMAAVNEPILPFVETALEDWVRAININLLGTVYSCRQILPHLIKKGGGKIVNFSGGGATSPFPYFSAYATSKAAVIRFTETIAEEVKPYGISINAVAPGAINTAMLDNMINAGSKVLGEEQYAKVLKQKQNGGDDRLLVGELIVFLLSDDSASLTGKLISAQWDNWKEWDQVEIERLNNCSEYTLRRIDNKYFQEIKK